MTDEIQSSLTLSRGYEDRYHDLSVSCSLTSIPIPLLLLFSQDVVIKGGVIELRQRDDEVRILKIEVAELQRSIAATTKVLLLVLVYNGTVLC